MRNDARQCAPPRDVSAMRGEGGGERGRGERRGEKVDEKWRIESGIVLMYCFNGKEDCKEEEEERWKRESGRILMVGRIVEEEQERWRRESVLMVGRTVKRRRGKVEERKWKGS